MARITTIFGLRDEVSPALKKIEENTNSLASSFSNMAISAMGISSVQDIANGIINKFHELKESINECVSMYQYQADQELKLTTIMKQRMNATDAEIQSIKDFASAQQALGVYGDEIQLQGAQELASFVSTTDAIKTLMPAMNNLIAQQYGYSASGREFQATADMIGKVLSGQTGALSRMGYVFSEEEKQLLKTGTEMERASVLAQIITDNVGNMNEALRNTPQGAMQDLNNTIGDMKENLGQALLPLQAMVSLSTGKVKMAFMDSLTKALNYINNHPMVRNILKGVVLGAITAIGIGLASVIIPQLATMIVQLGIINTLAGPIGLLSMALGGAVTAFSILTAKSNESEQTMVQSAKNVAMEWQKAHDVIFGHDSGGATVTASSLEELSNAYTAGIAEAEKQLDNIYREYSNLNWRTNGISESDAFYIGNANLELAVRINQQMEEMRIKQRDINDAIARRNAQLQRQQQLQKEINESNEKYKNMLEKIHHDYEGTDIGKQETLKKQLREYEDLYARGYMTVKKEGGAYDTAINERKDLTMEQKTELRIVIDELRKKLKTKGGALSVRDDGLLSIADDYRDLLSKRATERFNLQYKSVTPSVNINKMEVNNGADTEAVKNEIVAGLIEAQNACLSGVA